MATGSASQIVATAASEVKLWDYSKTRRKAKLEHHPGFRHVRFSPDGGTLATTVLGKEPKLIIWDVATWAKRGIFSTGGSYNQSIAFDGPGHKLAYRGPQNTVSVVDVSTDSPRPLYAWRGHEEEEQIVAVAFAPDGKTLASASIDGLVLFWDIPNGQQIERSLNAGNGLSSIAYGPDGKTLAIGYNDGVVKLFDLSTGAERARYVEHKNKINWMAFAPDDRTFVSTTSHHMGPLQLCQLWPWDALRKQLLPPRTLEGFTRGVTCVAFHPDGRTLATASGGATLKLWNVDTGKEFFALKGHKDVVWGVDFSPDGTMLASASSDGTVRIWHAERDDSLLRRDKTRALP